MGGIVKLLLWVLIIVVLVAGIAAWIAPSQGVNTRLRDTRVIRWLADKSEHPQWAMKAGERCAEAPFQFPTDGFIGYLYDDSFRPGHRHQGIDIFGGEQPGVTPVYAAASGYLSRSADWVSTVIIRIPDDPLQPGRQIWTYYTHMGDAGGTPTIADDFPPGTQEQYVEAGSLLGYQGNYSGTPGQPVGVHLHFSIVLDDGQGRYQNELQIKNTLDPSPYFGIELNAHKNNGEIPLCP
jgi:murein DD-endopeptidase MepM/ murein hydrolase activator NlpD